jgi:hypothetical protein
MTRPARIGERPSASRIDDLGSPDISVSPAIGLLEGDDVLVPSADQPPAAADLRVRRRCGRTLSPLGVPAPLAGFDPSTTGRFSGVHRGGSMG